MHPGYIPPTSYEDPLMDVSFEFKPKFKVGCTPAIVTPWIGGFTKYGLVDQSQVIDKTATCTCKYGGIIRFK